VGSEVSVVVRLIRKAGDAGREALLTDDVVHDVELV